MYGGGLTTGEDWFQLFSYPVLYVWIDSHVEEGPLKSTGSGVYTSREQVDDDV